MYVRIVLYTVQHLSVFVNVCTSIEMADCIQLYCRLYTIYTYCNARIKESIRYNFCVCQLECIRTTMTNAQSFPGKVVVAGSEGRAVSSPVSQPTAFPPFLLRFWYSEQVNICESRYFFLYPFVLLARIFYLALRWVLFLVIVGLHFLDDQSLSEETYFPCTPLFGRD